MWAQGCRYACDDESTINTVAFDSGIAAIPPSATCTEIDVGILKNILLISYLGFNCVLMEGSWIKSSSQGRRVIKKDSYGFWTVKYSCREVRDKDNPYVYPSNVSQVFFVDDLRDPAWKVVLRHDPRSKRITGDREIHLFDAPGTSRPTTSSRSTGARAPGSSSRAVHGDDAPEEVPLEQINAFLREEQLPEDDTHLDDTQWLDEVEVQYVE